MNYEELTNHYRQSQFSPMEDEEMKLKKAALDWHLGRGVYPTAYVAPVEQSPEESQDEMDRIKAMVQKSRQNRKDIEDLIKKLDSENKNQRFQKLKEME